MEFKYSMSIFFSHMGYIFKILAWVVISVLVTAAIGAAIFVPLAGLLARTTDASVYVEAVFNCARNVLRGEITLRAAIGDALPLATEAVKAIGDNPGAATAVVLGGILLYCIYSFMIGVSQYTIAHIVNNIMSSNLRLPFATTLIVNLKKSCKYSISRVIVCLPVDLLIATIIMALLFGLFPTIGFFSLPIIVLFFILALSLRACALAGWLPRMLYHPEEKVYTNLTRSWTYVKHNFKGLIKAFVLTYTIIYLLFAAFALPTGGLMAIILPSAYYFILRAIELVGHFKTHGNSFYTDGNTVIDTVEFGYRSSNQNRESEDIQ